MIDAFTARGVAHDIRHLLSTIQLSAELLEKGGDPAVTRQAQRIQRAIERSTAICTHLVDGTYEKASAPSRLGPLLADVVEQLSPPESITVRWVCPEPDLQLTAPTLPLFRALFNLATNALDAVSAHGGSRVDLRARVLDQRLVLTVEDDGPGLALGGGARANPKAPKSAGLGLHLVRKLIGEIGGTLKVARTGPEGTTFAIMIPLDGAAPPAVPQRVADPRQNLLAS
ncbi:MAG: HAMP domain-containing sensor histidine kinase [Pseudomonadota bacterium]